MKSSKVQSCCGSESYIYTIDHPILKKHTELFKNKGFSILEHYEKVGILQAVKQGLIITASYGHKKINVRCSGKNCNSLLNIFNSILDNIENEPLEKEFLIKKNEN